MTIAQDRVHAFRSLPTTLREYIGSAWDKYLVSAQEQDIPTIIHDELRSVLLRAFAYSEFVAETCIRQPQALLDLTGSGQLYRRLAVGELQVALATRLSNVADEPALGCALRQFRQQAMLRIAIRDLTGWAPLSETLAELSALADACVGQALNILSRWQEKDLGVPFGERSNQPVELVVIGMGKLGAGELNFSSDIDLIFAYREEGETRHGRRIVANEEYFTRLGRRLIAALDDTTADGFVFRVDMRLRPNGESGPLAMSFDAMEDYYQSQGRDWERYAMIKARCIAGDERDGAVLLSMLRPFVYRRYLDFGAFAALREMKQLIVDQVARKEMEGNVKLGPGGIREVEFIGQVFQLIRGGRETELQERSILPVLACLAAKGYLPDYVARELRVAYVFLRHTENRIQAMHDQQTQELPADEFTQQRLALAMGFATWDGFISALQRQMEIVHQHFQQVFVAPQTDVSTAGENEFSALWLGRLDIDLATDVLQRHGFSATNEVLERLQQLRESATYRQLTPSGRERLDRLIPLLIGAASQVQPPHQALLRTLQIIEAIGRRAAYYALLIEHPMAMSQLVKLCAASAWITDYVAKHPILLDDLLDPRALYTPLTKDALAAELRTELQHIQDEDVEQQMEVLRHFAHSNILRVACSDVANAMPLMVVSDHLTEIAEVVLAQVLDHSWRYLTARHGVPHCTVDGVRRPARFAVIAYGKLGGIELGYGSDLDLVFIHDSEGDDERTDGAKPLDNAVFFVRLAQRIIHVLNTQTVSGVLYEIDVRLRPSGAAGLLVSSLLRFADYQRKEAWTWEHQALVRARLVAGAGEIGAGFRAVRAEVLGRARDADTLRQEVREMREKMRAELGNRDPNVFDLKHDAGGIADIEFMVQYAVLRWAHDYPQLLVYPDNIRLLEILAKEKLLAPDAAQFLADAYRRLRGEVHRLTLQQLPARTDPVPFAELRARVTELWRDWFGA